jgi:hypothetical protein
MPPSVVLSGKRTNVPGLLLIPRWYFTTILTMGRLFSTPCDTKRIRYLKKYLKAKVLHSVLEIFRLIFL